VLTGWGLKVNIYVITLNTKKLRQGGGKLLLMFLKWWIAAGVQEAHRTQKHTNKRVSLCSVLYGVTRASKRVLTA
jgi:hypothetical protein